MSAGSVKSGRAGARPANKPAAPVEGAAPAALGGHDLLQKSAPTRLCRDFSALIGIARPERVGRFTLDAALWISD